MGRLESQRHPGRLHAGADQRAQLLDHVRARRRRRRGPGRPVAQRAAQPRELRAARRPRRATHRRGGARRHLRAAQKSRPHLLRHAGSDGRRADPATPCGARQRADHPPPRPLGRVRRLSAGGRRSPVGR